MNKWILTLCALAFITSCESSRVLNLNKLQLPIEMEVVGNYESKVRGNYGVIHLDSTKSFRYEFSNCDNKGYCDGKYVLKGNRLTLFSDSLFSEKWMDILEGNKSIDKSADTAKFLFIVTDRGLHEENPDGNFRKEPSFMKE